MRGRRADLTNTTLGLTFANVSSTRRNGILISGGSGSVQVTAATNLQNNAGVGISVRTRPSSPTSATRPSTSSAGDAVDLASNSGNITFADLDMTARPEPCRGLDAVNNTGTITVTSGDVTTSANLPGNGGATAAAVFVDGPGGRTPINLTFTSVTTTAVGNVTNIGSVTLIQTSGTKFQVTGTTQINSRAGHGVFVDDSTPATIRSPPYHPNPSAAGGDGIHVQATSRPSPSRRPPSPTPTDHGAERRHPDFIPDNDGDGNAIFLKGNNIAAPARSHLTAARSPTAATTASTTRLRNSS